jgi:hypothetical protein
MLGCHGARGVPARRRDVLRRGRQVLAARDVNAMKKDAREAVRQDRFRDAHVLSDIRTSSAASEHPGERDDRRRAQAGRLARRAACAKCRCGTEFRQASLPRDQDRPGSDVAAVTAAALAAGCVRRRVPARQPVLLLIVPSCFPFAPNVTTACDQSAPPPRDSSNDHACSHARL